MLNSQKKCFLTYEANAWFERNKSIIEDYKLENDKVIELISKYNLENNSVLEIGCSAGYRLNAIKELFPNSKVTGIEPSEKAIAFGKENYKNVEFVHGTADNLSDFENESLDIVIVGFVFYVIDRNYEVLLYFLL